MIARVKKILQSPSEIKNDTFQSQHVPFFLKKSHKFDRKKTLIRFHSMGPEHCFSLWENFPKF